ncbi:MAG: leucine-rich repeat protein, partial [Clostridia bacterium]|nr:leucine-rich repeat protein [Clostridia bacterium]
ECTSLTAINVASGNEAFYSAGGVLFTYDRKTLLEYPAGKTDAKYTVPSGTETISYEAFYENHYIEQVVLPSGLEYIGTWAFEGCSNLKTPVLPDGVKGIGGGAFNGTSVVYEEYNGVYYLGTASNKHYACVNWSDYLTEYVLHSDTKLVCGDAFCFHSDVEKIVLPEGLKYIGTYAFEYTYELTDISIPSTVETIGAYAFYYTGKSEFTIPGGVKEIENSAFERNDHLTDLVIEEGVKIIGMSAFMYCFELKTVTIPASVTEIRDYAFGYDDAIETVYYGGSEAQWNKLTKDLNWSNEALLNAKVIFGAVTEPGDCNGDGVVNNKDVVLLFKYVSEQEVTVVESACDFNGDGFVNNKDVSALFKKVSAGT